MSWTFDILNMNSVRSISSQFKLLKVSTNEITSAPRAENFRTVDIEIIA